MNNDKLQTSLDFLEKRFDEMNSVILNTIASDMKRFKILIPSQAYKIKEQLKHGKSIERIINELERTSRLSSKDIKTILEETAKENIDFANTYYKYRNLSTIDYSTSSYFQNLVNSIAETTNKEYKNLSRTTAIKLLDSEKKTMYLPVDKAYNEIIDKCALSVQSGQESYEKAIYETINQLSNSGIKKIYYDNEGKKKYSRRLDSSVRMNVLDSIHQLSMAMQNKFDEDLGCDGKEITAHVPCAIDHQDIQGKQFSKEDFEKLNSELKRPIGTMNCTHFVFNIIMGISKPLHTDEELERMKKESNREIYFQGKKYTQYQATQVQRKLETKLRDLKYKRDMLKVVDEPEQLAKVRKEITDTTKLYKDFSDKMGLEYKLNRARGVKRVNTKLKTDDLSKLYKPQKRKVETYGDEIYNKFVETGYEHLGLINNKTGERIGGIATSNLDYGVDYTKEQLELIKSYNRELTLIHTHPSDNTFSPEDIFEMFKNTSVCDILVETPNYEYFLIPNIEHLSNDSQVIEQFKDWLYKQMGIVRDDNGELSQSEFMHKAYDEIFNEGLNWKYGRRKK